MTKKRDVVAANDYGVLGVIEGTRTVRGCRIKVLGTWYGSPRLARFENQTCTIRVLDVYALEYTVHSPDDRADTETAHFINARTKFTSKE